MVKWLPLPSPGSNLGTMKFQLDPSNWTNELRKEWQKA